MAFATSNVNKSVFGNLKVTYGDWSGAVGDANGTIAVEGGRCFLAKFTDQDNVTNPGQEIPTFISTTGTTTLTVSIANRQTVTSGRFIIIHA